MGVSGRSFLSHLALLMAMTTSMPEATLPNTAALVSQSVRQPVSQSINSSISQSGNQSVDEPVKKSRRRRIRVRMMMTCAWRTNHQVSVLGE